MYFMVRHGSTWHFRWRVGKLVLKISLKTGNKRKAGLMARTIQKMLAREIESMDENQLRRALIAYRDALLRADDERRWTQFYNNIDRDGLALLHQHEAGQKLTKADRDALAACPGPGPEHYDALLHEELTLALTRQDFDFLAGLDKRFLEITGIDVSRLPAAEANKVRFLAGKELARVMDIQRVRMTGQYGLESILLSAMSGGINGQGPAVAATAKKKSILLSVARQDWESVLIAERKANTTLRKYIACIDEFIEINGDLELIDLSKEHCRHYRETIKLLPAKYKTRFRGQSIKKILKTKHDPSMLCDAVSINDKLNCIKQFFCWAVDKGHLDENYMDGLTVKAKKRSTTAHAPYSMADISAMFGPEYISRTVNESWHFWLPILALYTGARQSELAQLKVEDVCLVEEIWCIHIRPDETDSRSSVKTEAGIRTIPLHPFIVQDLHFIDYVASRKSTGKSTLWDITVPKTGGYGKNVSKWFMANFLAKVGLDDCPGGHKRAFHSFRSTLCTILKRAKVPGRMAAQVVGHVPPTVAMDWVESHSMTYDYYAGGFSIRDIYEAVTAKIDYGLDLSHLAASPWAGSCDFPARSRSGRRRFPMKKK
ncbi:MAG: site-specific integrase [Verrucomicrobiae bacterium]|nr:site-specific integrase [Verrucomicrobiae bacterium]